MSKTAQEDKKFSKFCDLFEDMDDEEGEEELVVQVDIGRRGVVAEGDKMKEEVAMRRDLEEEEEEEEKQ